MQRFKLKPKAKEQIKGWCSAIFIVLISIIVIYTINSSLVAIMLFVKGDISLIKNTIFIYYTIAGWVILGSMYAYVIIRWFRNSIEKV